MARGTIASMTDQAERYDRIAAGYARWWAPVIAPRAVDALDLLEPVVAAGARRIVDIGTGTGTLAVEAIRSLAVGRDRRDRCVTGDGRGGGSRGRIDSWRARIAGGSRRRSPSPTSCRSMTGRSTQPCRRSCSSSSRIGPWGAPRGAARPATGCDARVRDLARRRPSLRTRCRPRRRPRRGRDRSARAGGPARRCAERRAGDPRAAASGLPRRDRDPGVLEHPFDINGYVAFITQFDEADTYESLDRAERRRFDQSLRRRLARRDADELVLRLPVVAARAVRT